MPCRDPRSLLRDCSSDSIQGCNPRIQPYRLLFGCSVKAEITHETCMTSDDFEILLDCMIASIALSAAIYSLAFLQSYVSFIGGALVSAFIFNTRNHNLSDNIGLDLKNAHYLIIPALVLSIIWLGALNVKESQSSWPVIAGLACATLYIKDALRIYQKRR